MRRSRIRRKALTPAKWKDAGLLARFAEQHTSDEGERYLCGPVWERHCETWYIGTKRLHTHHIFHAGKRADEHGNLIRVSERAHRYLHKEPIGGAVACIWAVICREKEEYVRWHAIVEDGDVLWADWLADWKASIDEACGGEGMLGWVQAHRDGGRVPSYYLDTVQAILETF